MICANCGKTIDNESNFCKYCGDNLNPTSTDPAHTIFDKNYQPAPGPNIDLGYLIIAALVLVNVFMWFFWSLIFGASEMNDNKSLYKSIRVLSTILSIAQFAVMFIFAKRPVYKIIIGIIAVIITFYDFYYLWLTLTDNRY